MNLFVGVAVVEFLQTVDEAEIRQDCVEDPLTNLAFFLGAQAGKLEYEHCDTCYRSCMIITSQMSMSIRNKRKSESIQ